MKSGYTFIILTVLLLFCGCGESFDNAVIEVQNGVQIIHNEYPLWEDDPEVSLEFVRKYGELDTEDENLMLFRPTDVVCDNDGNIFILDTGNNRIQKFDPEGNFLMTISRKGQGPDELNNPYSMNIFNDEIYVCDMGNQRIQIFSTDGQLIRSIKMGFEGGKRFTNFRLLSTGEYLTKPAPFMFPNEDIKTVSLVHILDNECTPVKGIGAGDLEDFGDFVINVFMALSGYERDSDDNVYLAYGFQNKIEKYSADGTLVFRADRPLEINVNTNPTNQMDVVLVSHSIAVDMKDRLWVSTAVKQKSLAEMSEEDFQKEFDEQHVVLEIFNSGGILLGKIPLPEMGNTPALPPIALPSMGNIRIYGDRFFLVDIANKMCVYEYRIVEK